MSILGTDVYYHTILSRLDVEKWPGGVDKWNESESRRCCHGLLLRVRGDSGEFFTYLGKLSTKKGGLSTNLREPYALS